MIYPLLTAIRKTANTLVCYLDNSIEVRGGETANWRTRKEVETSCRAE